MKLSITFHPQTEHTIQTMHDILRSCVIYFKVSWDDHLPLIEFSYNNSYHSSILMTPFDELYGRRCRLPLRRFEVGEFSLLGPDIVYKVMEKV